VLPVVLGILTCEDSIQKLVLVLHDRPQPLFHFELENTSLVCKLHKVSTQPILSKRGLTILQNIRSGASQGIMETVRSH
jgi:hypothetical protein